MFAVRAGDLPAARLKDLIAASRSWEAKVAALQADAVRSISAREGHGDGGASVLRDQAGKSKFQARRSLGAAEVLDEMPGLRSSVDSGEVSLANAERLADAARRTAPEVVDSAADLPGQADPNPPRISPSGQRPRPAPTNSPRPLPGLTTKQRCDTPNQGQNGGRLAAPSARGCQSG